MEKEPSACPHPRGRWRLAVALGVVAGLTAGCQALVPSAGRGLFAPSCPWEIDPAQCLRSEWPGYVGALGVSDPSPTERAADVQATQEAIRNLLAQLLGVEVASELHVEVAEQTHEQEPAPSRSSVQVSVRGRFRLAGNLPGFEVLRRSVERTGGSFVVRVLVGVKEPARVTRAYEAAVMAGVLSSRNQMDAEMHAYRRPGDQPLEPLAVAVSALDAHLEVAQRLQAHSPAVALVDLEAHRAALLEARSLLLERYQQRLEELRARDAYPVAVELTVRLAQATNDPTWRPRVVAVAEAARDRAAALAREGAYEQALAVASVTSDSLRYLDSVYPAVAAALRELRASLEQHRPPRAAAHVQRVLVTIPEQIMQEVVPDPAVETEVIRLLSEAGFRVVSAAGRTGRWGPTDRSAPDFSDRLRELRARYGVDVLITGEAFAQPAAQLGGMWSARARAEVQVIRTDTGEVLGSYATHASGVDLTGQLAGKKALQAAGTQAGEWLIGLLSRAPGLATRRIELVVRGVGFEHSRTLIERIEALEGVRSVTLRDFTDGALWLDVETELSVLELATHLTGIVEISRLSGSRVEALGLRVI